MQRYFSAALIAVLLFSLTGCESLRHPAFAQPTPRPTSIYIDQTDSPLTTEVGPKAGAPEADSPQSTGNQDPTS